MDEKLVIKGFDSNFPEIFEKFLSCYTNNKKSVNNYRNAFTKLLEHINKSNVSMWSLADYKSVLEKGTIASTTQIFRFLYAYDYLEDVDNFTSEFGNKKLILKSIEKKTDTTKIEYKSAITLNELERLVSWVNNIVPDDFEKMRIAFSFYLLFDLGLPIQKVNEFKAENYNKSFYEFADGDVFEIPEKFELFLEDLKQKPQRTGLSTANINISDLGRYVGITDLQPKQIVAARKQRILQCSECGNELLSSLDNWVSINGYLVCKDCGEQIIDEQDVKKNEIINNIPNFILDFADDKENLDDDTDSDEEQLTQDNEEFSEGNQYLKKHLVRERNQELIKKAKAKFIKLNGNLYCEVCTFDFTKVYGTLGENFIEAHHVKPVSEMTDDEKTNVDDLAMVCPNCHSMLHRKKPWIRKEDLKKILISNLSLDPK